MRFQKRLLFLAGAMVSFSAALFLILRVGLPERAQFTGWVNSDGFAIAPELGAIAPPFEAPTLDGDTLSIADWKGSPLVINFWATWCEPCLVEMPALQAIYDHYQDSGLKLVAVNLGETQQTVHAWVQRMNLTFDIALDPTLEIASLYQLRGQPSTYVISPEGVISHTFYGPTTETMLQNALAPYFPN